MSITNFYGNFLELQIGLERELLKSISLFSVSLHFRGAFQA
jgi:hypothetical protein